MKDLSVIISTWNNSQRLSITLKAISECVIPDSLSWELVIVNNNSSDNTDEVVAHYLPLLPIKYIREPKQGLSRARNTGLSRAIGRLILFTDDDVKPCPDWILQYWAAFQQLPKDFYFGGPIESEFEGAEPSEELLRYAPSSVRGLDWGGRARQLSARERLISANWACPREALDLVGGFNEELGLNPSSGQVATGEEAELMKRLRDAGWSPWYIPEARLKHFVPANKCSVNHIADRQEAYGFYVGAVLMNGASGGGSIAGVPLGLYKQAVAAWIRWIFAKASGQRGYDAYIEWRRAIGRLRGVREREKRLTT